MLMRNHEGGTPLLEMCHVVLEAFVWTKEVQGELHIIQGIFHIFGGIIHL
jgi:hypothetical protein